MNMGLMDCARGSRLQSKVKNEKRAREFLRLEITLASSVTDHHPDTDCVLQRSNEHICFPEIYCVLSLSLLPTTG